MREWKELMPMLYASLILLSVVLGGFSGYAVFLALLFGHYFIGISPFIYWLAAALVAFAAIQLLRLDMWQIIYRTFAFFSSGLMVFLLLLTFASIRLVLFYGLIVVSSFVIVLKLTGDLGQKEGKNTVSKPENTGEMPRGWLSFLSGMFLGLTLSPDFFLKVFLGDLFIGYRPLAVFIHPDFLPLSASAVISVAFTQIHFRKTKNLKKYGLVGVLSGLVIGVLALFLLLFLAIEEYMRYGGFP